MKLEFSWQIFEKHSNIKFHENPPSESRVVPCGRTDRHDKANNHFSHFRESAWNSTFCPHSAFMCFVWIWEQTAIIFLYSINWLVFITETECVYCAVRTESLNTVYVNIGIKNVNFTTLIWMLSVCHFSCNISVMIGTSGHILRIRRASFALRKIRGVTCQAEELQCTLDSPSLGSSIFRFFRSLAL